MDVSRFRPVHSSNPMPRSSHSAELRRIAWDKYVAAGPTENIVANLEALASAADERLAEAAYRKIEGVSVCDGKAFEIALPLVTAVLDQVQVCTPCSRRYLLELLVELVAGVPDSESVPGDLAEFKNRVNVAACEGLAIYFRLLQVGTHMEQLSCIDLLGLCALYDKNLTERVRWYFVNVFNPGSSELAAKLISNWLAELDAHSTSSRA